MTATATLVKNPITGTFESNMGTNPGSDRSLDFGGGAASGIGPPAAGGNPYTIFNRNLATILSQMQQQSMKGANDLGTARDTMSSALVSSGPAYNSNFSPDSNLAGENNALQEGTSGPGITSVNTQLENTNAGIGRLGTVIGGLETAYQPNYQPTLNPNTGQMDGFDTKTGNWASGESDLSANGGSVAGSTPAEMGAHGVLAGVNLGATPGGLGAYATDPNYVDEVGGVYKSIATSGVANSAPTLDAYIKGHATGSPVTGQMILNAASQYGVDASLLTALFAHESDFGTAGAATKTMNPGNVGNTGTSTQTFNSWQQGVNAAAANLAQRKVKAPAETPGETGTSNVGGKFSDVAAQKVALLPGYMQNFVDSGVAGVAYINNDRVPDQYKTAVQTQAARAGIPYVQAGDANAVKAMQTVLSSLNQLQTLSENNLSPGVGGHVMSLTLAPAQQYFQTEKGNDLALFNSYRQTAIKDVQALAGGAGSGLRINGSEIEASVNNLPQATDSREHATKLVQQAKLKIYTNIATSFPYAEVPVMDAKGNKGTVPASQISQAVARGASIQ